MTKVRHCNDVMSQCHFVARGETEEEVLQKAEEHAQSAHRMTITGEVEDKMRGAIRDG